jgi:outer membrane protein insertion porin family
VDVRVEGNRRVTDAGFFRLTTLRSGQPYDAEHIRSQFRLIWGSGLFDDLWVEALEAPRGKVVVFHVVERPVVVAVSYTQTPVVAQSAIEDHLAEQNLSVRLNEPLNRERIRAVEEAIKRLHEQKGFLGTEVRAEVEELADNKQTVTFRIKPGAKTLIQKIDFTGNTIFSDRALKGMMKNTIETGFKGAFSKKDLYHPIRFAQEMESVRGAYLSKGRLDVVLKPPIVEFTQKKKKKKAEPKPVPAPKEPPPGETDEKRRKRLAKEAERRAKAEKKANKPPPKRRATLIVPIEEGPEYRLGNIEMTGGTVFSDEVLKALIPLSSGDVFDADALRTGLDNIESLYGQRGYFYAATNREIHRREEAGYVADVRVVVNEGQQYALRRIEFTGNPSTRDRVLRRELPISEGEVFNSRLWRIGLTRVNQLGYWAVTQEPEITPVEGEAGLDARVAGSEQGRNEIQVGGGFSGAEGAFFQGSYATRNFLGRGEILQASVQFGGRSQLINLSFTEPYFMGTRNTVGGSIFSRELEYTDFTRETRGFSLLFGQRVGNFASYAVTYRNERFDEFGGSVFYFPVGALPPEYQDVDPLDLFTGGTGTLLPPEGVRTTNSTLIPVYSFNTVNNPFRPSRGLRLRTSLEFTGGFLGGDNEFYKPIVDFTYYVPAFKRSHLAFHVETGLVRAFNNNLIPRSERFFLGGDIRGPRVFETRSLAPLGPVAGVPPLVDSEGNIIGIPFAEVGGDSFFLSQNEFILTLADPFDIAFFLDAGQAFVDEVTGFDLGELRYSAGLEARFYLPVFQAPLRLIWGKVLDEEPQDRINSFQFSLGFPF